METSKAYEQYRVNKSERMRLRHPLVMGNEFMLALLRESPAEEWQQLAALADTCQWVMTVDWLKHLTKDTTALVITDSQQRITWVNSNFTRMTKYPVTEVLGRRPSFLQGPETDPHEKVRIRQRLTEQQTYTGTLLNYRKSGEPYLCRVRILPLFNTHQELVHFVAVENEVPMAKELTDTRALTWGVQ